MIELLIGTVAGAFITGGFFRWIIRSLQLEHEQEIRNFYADARNDAIQLSQAVETQKRYREQERKQYNEQLELLIDDRDGFKSHAEKAAARFAEVFDELTAEQKTTDDLSNKLSAAEKLIDEQAKSLRASSDRINVQERYILTLEKKCAALQSKLPWILEKKHCDALRAWGEFSAADAARAFELNNERTAHVLRKLTQNGYLTREKMNGRYMYSITDKMEGYDGEI